MISVIRNATSVCRLPELCIVFLSASYILSIYAVSLDFFFLITLNILQVFQMHVYSFRKTRYIIIHVINQYCNLTL